MKNEKVLWIIGLIILAVLFYKYSGTFVIQNGDYTGYKSFTFSSDYSKLFYSDTVGLDYNTLKNNNVYIEYLGGNRVNFADAKTNPQLVMFYLINYFNVDKNDLNICYTDSASLSSGCGTSNSGAVCPTSDAAASRVSSLITPYGFDWSGNPPEYMCPGSPGNKYIQTINSNIMNNLSSRMICNMSGKYKGCNANGNDCGSETDYNLFGNYVTWEDANGFNCYVNNLPSTPQGYSDTRVSGNVEFRLAQNIPIYRLENNSCNPYSISELNRKVNDYSTDLECQQYILSKSNYYRLSNNQCNQIELYFNEVTSNDYNSSEDCLKYVLSSYYRVINSTCYSISLYGYQKTNNDYISIPISCSNVIQINNTIPGENIYIQNISYINVTTNQTVEVIKQVPVEPTFLDRYGILIGLLIIIAIGGYLMYKRK